MLFQEGLHDEKIFEQVELNHISLKNRLVRSATWEGIAEPDGGLTEEAYKIYGELAKGGVGMIITGFTSVMTNDFYFDGMMRLSKDELIPQYRKLTDLIHRENCRCFRRLPWVVITAGCRMEDIDLWSRTI